MASIISFVLFPVPPPNCIKVDARYHIILHKNDSIYLALKDEGVFFVCFLNDHSATQEKKYINVIRYIVCFQSSLNISSILL